MRDDSVFIAFKDIYKNSNLFGHDEYLIKDGIINEDLYGRQNLKILVIAKEHNFVKSKEDPNGYEGDYKEWWNHHVYLRFSHRISEWCFGLLDNFETKYKDITYNQKHEALKSIAFINVKKTGGSSSSDKGVILNYIGVSKNLLHQQILNINPDLIVCCFYYDFYVNQLFDIQVTRLASKTYGTGVWMGKKVINFHHPSSRKNKEFLFNQFAESARD